MIRVYAEHISPRLRYIAELIFHDILGTEVDISSALPGLNTGPWLNYSVMEIKGIPFIRPHSLLFETSIRAIPEHMSTDGILFPTESDIAEQDILAASFFLVSRYEEYLTQEKDSHGRPKGSDSLQHKAGLLESPLIDEWAISLRKKLKERYPELQFKDRKFSLRPTFDIDVAFAYKGRGLWRRTRSWAKDLLNMDKARLKERRQVSNGEKADPYDSYSYQKRICEQAQVDPHHFFLLGDYGPLDKNLAHTQPILRELIQDIASWSQVGIHPSIGSHRSTDILQAEVYRLEEIIGEKITKSRQHFLKVDLPKTYQDLIKVGIKEDYSMGYADQIGFRAGTCSPFRWYDLSDDEATDLLIIPTAVMDSTLKDYMRLEIPEAITRMRSIKKNCEAVQGQLTIIWHNHSASRQGEWLGWRAVLEAGLFD